MDWGVTAPQVGELPRLTVTDAVSRGPKPNNLVRAQNPMVRDLPSVLQVSDMVDQRWLYLA